MKRQTNSGIYSMFQLMTAPVYAEAIHHYSDSLTAVQIL